MKKLLNSFVKVIKAYTLEEKMISVVLAMLFCFLSFKGLISYFNPASLFTDKGVYTEAEISIKPVIINPLLVDFSPVNRDISSLVFTGLVKFDPKLRSFVGDLATLKISEDKKQYIFTMRDGVKWHDGEPLTVDDAIFTYNLIQDPAFQNPLIKANFDGVKIEKISDNQIQFSLSRPNSFFISSLNVGLLPNHLLHEHEVAELASLPFNLNPVGSGPYKIKQAMESMEDGRQRVVLEKFDNYYGFKPVIGQIKFNVYPDEESLLKEKDGINVIARSTTVLEALLYEGRFKAISYSLPQYTAVFFNMESPLLKKSKIRLGLLKSIDKEQLLSNLKNKVRVDTPLMDLNQKDWVFKPDLKEANGALFDSGYQFKKDDKGVILPNEKYRKDKQDKILEFNLIARQFEEGSSQAEEVNQVTSYLISSWEKTGVKVNLSLLDEAAFYEAVTNRSYDMILTGQSMGYNLDTFPFWHSSQSKSGGLNLANFNNFGVDALIEKMRETFEEDEKVVSQKKLADIVAKEAPALFLYRPSYLLLSDGKVQNIYLNDLSYVSDRFASVADFCINKDCK